jgi:hypothetical protein
MTRRKGEITARMNERDLPHIVEVALPDGGFGWALDAMYDFHRLRGIQSRQGRRQRRDEQEYVRWCFASVIDADVFAQQFGGHACSTRGYRNERASAALSFPGAKENAADAALLL